MNGSRIDASLAERGQSFTCPSCNKEVILKRGRIVVPHFAHKPPVECSWVKGETRAHLEAKRHFQLALNAMGYRSETEYIVETLSGDRRADVMVFAPDGDMLAIELQHSSISLPDIEKRAHSYASSNLAQLWIPFLNKKHLSEAKHAPPNQWIVEKYPAKDFEKWIHGFHGGVRRGLWMWEPDTKSLYHATLEKAEYYVDESSWYENGEEVTVGGYFKTYKRYRKLSLSGPYELGTMKICLAKRNRSNLSHYNWPAGRFGILAAK